MFERSLISITLFPLKILIDFRCTPIICTTDADSDTLRRATLCNNGIFIFFFFLHLQNINGLLMWKVEYQTYHMPVYIGGVEELSALIPIHINTVWLWCFRVTSFLFLYDFNSKICARLPSQPPCNICLSNISRNPQSEDQLILVIKKKRKKKETETQPENQSKGHKFQGKKAIKFKMGTSFFFFW